MDENSSQDSDDLVIILDSDPSEVSSRIQFLTIRCLICDRIVQAVGVLAQLRRIWSLIEVVSVKSLRGNLYSINFANKRSMEVAIEDSSFVVSNCCFSLRKWPEGVAIDEIDFTRMPIWIQIHRILIDLMSRQNAATIASRIGELVAVDDPFEDSSGGSFLRAHVIIDIDKPLIDRYWIPRKGRERICAFVKYENLQDFRYACGRLGHTLKSCGKDVVLTPSGECRYSDRLRVTPIRFSMSVRRQVRENPLRWYDEEMRRRYGDSRSREED